MCNAKVNKRMVRGRYLFFEPWLLPGLTLDAGMAFGHMGKWLPHPLVGLDASASFCEHARTLCYYERIVCSRFEDYIPETRFNNVVLACVLEHVADPVGLLRMALRWGRRLFICVPNANATNRLAAVTQGRLAAPTVLTDSDRKIGHLRMYILSTLLTDIEAAGGRQVSVAGFRATEWDGPHPAVDGDVPHRCGELGVIAEDVAIGA